MDEVLQTFLKSPFLLVIATGGVCYHGGELPGSIGPEDEPNRRGPESPESGTSFRVDPVKTCMSARSFAADGDVSEDVVRDV
jgi:hypothetical protein